jgi:hypothetical protein
MATDANSKGLTCADQGAEYPDLELNQIEISFQLIEHALVEKVPQPADQVMGKKPAQIIYFKR